MTSFLANEGNQSLLLQCARGIINCTYSSHIFKLCREDRKCYTWSGAETNSPAVEFGWPYFQILFWCLDHGPTWFSFSTFHPLLLQRFELFSRKSRLYDLLPEKMLTCPQRYLQHYLALTRDSYLLYLHLLLLRYLLVVLKENEQPCHFFSAFNHHYKTPTPGGL